MLNFTKLARDKRLPYLTQGHHHCHAGWAQTHCPRCSAGKGGWHLGFNLKRGNFNCWRCGPVKVLEVIRGLLRCDKERALEIAREYAGAASGGRKAPSPRRRGVVAPRGLGPLQPAHVRYLHHSRGLPPSIVDEWQLQATGAHSDVGWAWRVCGPIWNEVGDVVAWIGRSIGGDVPRKYLVTEDAKCAEDPRTFVYGVHKVPGDAVIIVEGPADAWSIGPGAVSTLGISWTPEKANKLRRFKSRFIMFDPEPLAQAKAEELAEYLSWFPGETEIITGLPSDPGDLSRPYVRRLRRRLLGE